MKITTVFYENYNQDNNDYIKGFAPKFDALCETLNDVSCVESLFHLYNNYQLNKDISLKANPFIYITFEINNNTFNCINFSQDAFNALLSIVTTEVIKDIRIVF